MTTETKPTPPIARKATVSGPLPGAEFPFRTFYYTPGTGFEAGCLIYYGWNEFRTQREAEEAAQQWRRYP